MTSRLGEVEAPPYFRTLHSLGRLFYPKSNTRVMNRKDYEDCAKEAGLIHVPFLNGKMSQVEAAAFIHSYGQATGQGVYEVWEQVTERVPVPWVKLKKYLAYVEEFKISTGTIEFSDMLTHLTKTETLPYLDTIFVDEAQDLSPLQWMVVNRLSERAGATYFVGDPNQAIYSWAGGSMTLFDKTSCDDQLILSQSYRLPRRIHDLSQRLASKFNKSYEFHPKSDEGVIIEISDFSGLNFSNGESWLILARNKYFLKPAKDFLESRGVFFHDWSDKFDRIDKIFESVQIYNSALESGLLDLPAKDLWRLRKITKADIKSCLAEKVPAELALGLRPTDVNLLKAYFAGNRHPVAMSTFHSAKGREADNVVILDAMNRTQERDYNSGDLAEAMALYVAVTRAKNRLFVWKGFHRYRYNLDEYYHDLLGGA